MKRMIKFASEKGASSPLTVIPISEMDFTSNKRQFRNILKWRYDCPIENSPTRCACGDLFDIDHAMLCRQGGFII